MDFARFIIEEKDEDSDDSKINNKIEFDKNR